MSQFVTVNELIGALMQPGIYGEDLIEVEIAGSGKPATLLEDKNGFKVYPHSAGRVKILVKPAKSS